MATARRRIDKRRLSRLGLGALAIALGMVAVAVARRSPDGSFAGDSVADAILELAAGLSLHRRRPRVLVAAAGQPLRPAARRGRIRLVPARARQSGRRQLCGVHARARVRDGLLRRSSHTQHSRTRAADSARISSAGAVAGGYVAAIGLLGLAPALVFDPAAQGCLRCPTNLVLVHGDAGAYSSLLRWGRVSRWWWCSGSRCSRCTAPSGPRRGRSRSRWSAPLRSTSASSLPGCATASPPECSATT